ncbi:MAG: PAS domain-containing sensor histidine kinase [Bacteroidetes bacterium]|nr:PAS domain-containing sensor histidine kinase [Bacteroidota bacterium]
MQIYDEEIISQNSLLYDSRKKDTITFNISEQTITIPLVFNEKKWTLHFSKPIQNFAYFQSKVLIVLFSGLVISLLLFSFSLSLFNTRFRAQQIAEELTLEIREDEHALILKNQEIQAQNEIQKALNEKLSQRNNELIIAKAKIEESEDGFKNMFERHSAIMLLIEPLEGIILGANNAAVEFYGYSKSTLLTMNIYKINTLPPEEIKTLRKNTKDNNENSFTAPHKLANGEIRTVEVHSTPIKFQEKQILFSVIHDVTERKQSELALMESEIKLRELNITKDKFFSIIAHDLKSPFNSIIGFCNLLLDKIQNKDITNIDRYAQIIIQSSNKAMSLLMNLMEWSRSQTGRMSFNPEYFEMVALINETKLFYESIASQKSISIKTSLPPHIFISADKAMISTVLRNLISNAVKYTKSGGEISIAAVEKQNEIIFSVRDTGVGISPKSLLKLFRIDQSYSTTGTNNEVGTGLGLILCKEFIEKHDGEIWAESEVGLGSTFYFSLPYNI